MDNELINLILEKMCGVMSTIDNVNLDTQVIESIGEVEIDGCLYQIQFLLEPKQSNWAKEHETVIRKTIE